MSSNKGAILIRNGTVVNEDQIFSADVLIRDGKIVKVFETMDVPQNEENLEIIDASDCYVIPGGIDPHTHMQLPFMGEVAADDFYTGTRAALAGGTTMIIDFVISTRALPPLAAYAQWRAWADPKVCCDYGLSMAITYWDEKETPKEMATVSNVEYGINSFKFFMAYKNLYMVDDYELFQDNIGLMHNCPRFLLTRFYSLPMESTDRQANGKQSLKWMGLKVCAKIGALARVHAENGSVIAAKQQELLAQGVTGPEGHPQSRPEEVNKLLKCSLFLIDFMFLKKSTKMSQNLFG